MQRREELLKNKAAPTQKEIQMQCGSHISDIFFDSLPKDSQLIMGIQPILKGPGEQLWLSPSDILEGKVILMAPLTRKHVCALTHKGIMELGEQIMHNFEEQQVKEKYQAISDAVKAEKIAAREEHKNIAKQVMEEALEQCNQQKKQLIKQFNSTIKDAVDVTRQQYVKKMKATIQKERWEIQEFLNEEKKVTLLNQEKHLIHCFQVNELEKLNFLNWEYQSFILGLKKEEEDKLRKLKIDFEHELEKIKAERSCANCIDMSLKIAQEHEKCQAEKHQIIFNYERKISRLNKVIQKMSSRTEQIEYLKTNAEKQIKVWKSKMKSLIKEFQKFINYALNAVPGQAEFLLTLHKLLVAEEEKPDLFEKKFDIEAEKLTHDINISEAKKSLDSCESVTAPQISRSSITYIVNATLKEILDRTEKETAPAEEIADDIINKVIQASIAVDEIKFEILQSFENETIAPATETINSIFERLSLLIQKPETVKESTEIMVMEDKAVQTETVIKREALKDASTTTHADAFIDTAAREEVHLSTKEEFLEKRLQNLLAIFQKHASLTNIFVASGSVHTKK